MLLQNMDRDALQQILTQLDQALYNHQQWHNDLLRTLACRLPNDKHDIIDEAHKECRFGQWYYSAHNEIITTYPGFIAIGDAHQRMHQLASHILMNLQVNNTVTPFDYDNFANSLERLRLEIYALKNEIEILLYNRDPLTMAINRITMLPILREQQELAKRQFQSCCIAMVDLDLFKNINDLYGHVAGDKILAAISHYFINNLRPYDKTFRYGGEEFLLCIQQIGLAQAFEMIERIREEIALMPFDVGLHDPINITISCGITILDPDTTVEQSIDRADKALYFAKKLGKNRIQTWNQQMSQNST